MKCFLLRRNHKIILIILKPARCKAMTENDEAGQKRAFYSECYSEVNVYAPNIKDFPTKFCFFL
ncbi:hypothetical protein AXI59_10160 [Bacillus nakamurai]|uniref:Uncharacterized protein n=1 Tax=Bacillus nakamurai TaxID=1793963 RepID=A0A150F6D0_9BACI|nr:hypothetical protein AXI58_16930 [Bacillus nakamurai]KXZ23083.1 hypothetical protein AXI59_10160 [Bacillus nakamurai]